MKAIDTSVDTTGRANKLASEGVQAVGVYLRADRCSQAMLDDLRNAGIQIWSTYERGNPTHDGYFSSDKGASDGAAAAAFALSVGQPRDTQIYAAVDYDPSESAVNGVISDYMQSFKDAIAPAGYVSSVYASGRACRILIDKGLAQTGWLTQSTGFAGYHDFKPDAGIVQLPAINDDFDGDDIPDSAVVGLW